MNDVEVAVLDLACGFVAGTAILGIAAGVMLAASFFSLTIPSLEVAEELTGSVVASAMVVVAGLVIGVCAIAVINERMPHAHFVKGRHGPMSPSLQKIWPFVFAITTHIPLKVWQSVPASVAAISATARRSP